jgi:outer membrane protein
MKNLFAVICIFLSLGAQAERLGLQDFIKVALEQSPQLGEQKAQVEIAKAQQSLARAKALFGGKLESFVAPVPGAEGDNLHSRTKWEDWGPAFSNSVEIWQPLYTFEALGAARKAAKAGVQAEEKLLERDRWKLRYEIAELYYGYQLAYELSELGQDFKSKLEQAYDRVEHERSARSRRILYNLNEMKAQLGEALKAKEQVRMAMLWKIGRFGDESVQWDMSNLTLRKISEDKLNTWKEDFAKTRPEWQALDFENEARRQLVRVEEGQAWPQIFVFGKATFNNAANRDNRTDGPFAYDPSNTKVAVGGLGLRWNLGFFELGAQRAKARAESLKASAKKSHLQLALLVEAERNLGDLRQKKEALDFRRESVDAAKKSWRESMVSYGLKNLTAEKLFESMGEYGQLQKKYLEALNQYNLATFKFEQSLGREIE